MDITVQTPKNFTRLVGVLILLFSFTVQPSLAQPSDYQRLAFQNNQPNIYVDVLTLPGDGNNIALTTIFRLNYKFLPFRKINNPAAEGEYISTANLNIEIFKSPKKDLEPDKQVKMKGLESVGRTSWQDTAYAANYEQTQSQSLSLNGSMQVQVQPGFYTYFLQLNKAEGAGTQNSRSRNIRVFPYKNQKNGDIILAKEVDNINKPTQLTLVNMGNNVTYGQDFYAFIHLPDYEEGTSYSMQINRIKPAEKEEDPPQKIKEMVEQSIAPNQIHTGIIPKLNTINNVLMLDISKTEKGHAYALVKIPNQSFPNAVYQLRVKADDKAELAAQRLFQSYWSDIPTSLLSLDVAVDMLRFIADKETIKKIDDGSDQQREEKFRAFWKEKDPTPNTEFNELQTEYYQRIDHTYREFTSNEVLGFNSDRGNIYIRFGPPNDTKRTFPGNGPTKEVWTYNNRTFVFEATSGFGDFKLVSN